MTMKVSLVLALVAAPALAFQPTSISDTRPSISLQNALRNMASYTDNSRMNSSFEAFDRNGAFSRSPQGGMGGQQNGMMMQGGGQEMMMQGQMNGGQMMNNGYGGQMNGGQMMNNGYGGGGGNPNPFSRRGGGNDRMYTQDGFDPFSAYGTSHGASQSDRRNNQGGPGMMMGGGGGGMMSGMNGVRNDNTMGGFSYSSRVRDQGRTMDQYQGQAMQQMQNMQMQNMQGGGGGQYGYEGMGGGGGYDMEMMGGYEGGEMDYQYEQMQQQQQEGRGGGYGNNHSRREHPKGPHRAPSSSSYQGYSSQSQGGR